MLNWIWLGLILTSIVYAAFMGNMEAVQAAVFESTKSAINLIINLVGIMVFMLGLMRVAFDAGLRDAIARFLAPLLRRLFPEVPADHPAMGAMVMNMASNIFGLGNAATPFGLKAMVELRKLNPYPGSASNAMVLFLAINTSSITLFPPTGTIAVRAAAGSADPFAIWVPTLIATTCSTLAAVGVFFLLRNLSVFRHAPLADGGSAGGDQAGDALDEIDVDIPAPRERIPMGHWRRLLIVAVVAALAAGLIREAASLVGELGARDTFTQLVRTWLFPVLIGGLLLVGVAGRVRVYESAIEGAKEGLQVAVRIVPYLVAILVAVGMFRASGALDLLIGLLNPLTSRFDVPAEVLPMALLRPLSGSGAFAVMSETLTAYGPDSLIGMMTSTLQGSTETTFYVLALYFGAARIREGRHALVACLCGDLAGFLATVIACNWFFA
ncbi:MAG: nucleoside recognition domain-containing protein [Myxococcota bacterium]